MVDDVFYLFESDGDEYVEFMWLDGNSILNYLFEDEFEMFIIEVEFVWDGYLFFDYEFYCGGYMMLVFFGSVLKKFVVCILLDGVVCWVFLFCL